MSIHGDELHNLNRTLIEISNYRLQIQQIRDCEKSTSQSLKTILFLTLEVFSYDINTSVDISVEIAITNRTSLFSNIEQFFTVLTPTL